MQAVINTKTLLSDGIISVDQAREIELRAREAMVQLVVNTVLFSGILAATSGIIFWLADAVAVAVLGAAMMLAGLLISRRNANVFEMFGQAATLIGAGLWVGGLGVELFTNHPDIAGISSLIIGVVMTVIAVFAFQRAAKYRFVLGAILIMTFALHLAGAGYLVEHHRVTGWWLASAYFYATLAIAALGTYIDVRFITALAIVPFAQMLAVSSDYSYASYVFYSKESTLSIVQMLGLIGLLMWLGSKLSERLRRHSATLTIMAFIVANMCALVGALWGDVVGEHIWGPLRPNYRDFHADGLSAAGTYAEARAHFEAAHDAFLATALVISDHAYAIIWAIALAAIAGMAAHKTMRGLFNTAITFGAIHAYTQAFESFHDEPLAYVIGGLAAIPLAWGMWRWNAQLALRTRDHSTI
ncbi:hypothetical protein [Pacificibacter sp. AS14]|uniref:hypothetical protein n=1 Tax=Pacificibacter sp. AS14 TaxID=3135785 RepID=UPI0031741428